MESTAAAGDPGGHRAASPSRGASQADVAREAGVSGQTVSRVANGRENVDAATRDRVLAAMRQVGYRPNSAARALRNGLFRSIGIIMFELSTFGNVRTLEAVAWSAARRGYSINLMPVNHLSQGEVFGAFRQLSEQAVDGVVILIEAHVLNQSDFELPAGLPMVVIDSNARYDYPIVDINQAQGAQLATEHLLELGHRTVSHVAGPRTSYAAERREASWRSTLREHRRPVPRVLVGNWSADSGYRAGRILSRRPGVTAVFAANDQMALGLLRAMHEAGRRVPEDISIVGFDDTQDASNFWPPLTTISQSFAEIGDTAVDALLTQIETGHRETGLITVPTSLVVRQSSGPAPSTVTDTPT